MGIGAAAVLGLLGSTHLAAAQSGFGPNQAGPGVSSPRNLVQNFDVDQLGPILTELGFVWTERRMSNGVPYLASNYNGALVINFIPAACLNEQGSNCIGLITLAQFDGVRANPQSIAAFNQKYWFTSAGSLSSGAGAYISRYDIADFGIPRGNLASSIKNFVVLASKFQDEISSGARTVSLDGYADDLSASYLNANAAAQAGIALPRTRDFNGSERHAVEFEAAPMIVKILAEDPEAPRNKISNTPLK